MFRPEDIILGWLVNLHIFLSVIAIIVFTPCSENLSEAEFYSFKNDLVSMELPAMNLATAYRLKKSFQVFFSSKPEFSEANLNINLCIQDCYN